MLPLGWAKRLTALSINSYWGDPCFLGKTLHLWFSRSRSAVSTRLSTEQHPWRSTRVTHASLRYSASMELQGKEMLSLWDTHRSTHPSIRWRHCEILRPTRNFLQMHLQEPEFFFWFTSDAFPKRPVSSCQDSYVKFLQGHLQAKVVPKQTLIAFLEESREEYLKRLCKQTPLWLVIMRKSLRKPEEQADRKKRDVEQSAPTHTRHTHCFSSQLGTTADRRCDVPWDWLWEAWHMARVCWQTRCKGFRSEEGLYYQMEQSVRNHLERNQVWRAHEKSSSSCRQTSNNQPYSQVRKSLWDTFPELCCIDLAEAYATQKKCQFED